MFILFIFVLYGVYQTLALNILDILQQLRTVKEWSLVAGYKANFSTTTTKNLEKKVRLQLTMIVKNILQIRDVKLKSERDIAMFIFDIFTFHGVVAHVLDVSGYRDRM